MNDLIMELNYQHCRFRRSCEWLLIGLVEDGQLKALLDGTRENWEKALEGGLKGKLQIKLGVEFNVYTATIVEIQKNLKQLEEVLGFDAVSGHYSELRVLANRSVAL